MQCYMKNEDNSLIDVENVETTDVGQVPLPNKNPGYADGRLSRFPSL